MSTNVPVATERRRKPDAVRRDALEVGRRLLIAGGPGAITLKAVGAELGMSHANLIHHFGSAEAFQSRLKDLMVQDLTRRMTAIIADGAGAMAGSSIVDQVFDAYAEGGIGMLMAWSLVSGGPYDEAGMAATMRDLVAALEPLLGGADTTSRARQMVSLVTLLAFADSLIGAPLADAMGGERDAVRRLTSRLLDMLGGPARRAAAGLSEGAICR